MKRSFTAQLEDIADLTLEGMEYVMQQSISDVLVAAQTTQIGITQGATSFEEGKIPVGKGPPGGRGGELVNSLTVDGAEGPASYVNAIQNMEIGDIKEFAWTAPYAMRIEAGFSDTDSLGRKYNVPGRFFVGANARRFEEFVRNRAAEVRR